MMVAKRFLSPIGILLVVVVLALLQGCVPMQPMQGGKAPVITSSYMIEKGRFGDILKIYIAADDPDNDMLRITTVVEQIGYGRYPTDWIYIKAPYDGRFVGYLQWNTFSRRTSFLQEWTQITVKVSVQDKAGHESNVVVFPFEFISEVINNPPPPSPFDVANLPKLGNVTIDLVEPSLDTGGNDPWPD
jgi:hypothetical protein